MTDTETAEQENPMQMDENTGLVGYDIRHVVNSTIDLLNGPDCTALKVGMIELAFGCLRSANIAVPTARYYQEPQNFVPDSLAYLIRLEPDLFDQRLDGLRGLLDITGTAPTALAEGVLFDIEHLLAAFEDDLIERGFAGPSVTRADVGMSYFAEWQAFLTKVAISRAMFRTPDEVHAANLN